MRKKISTTIYVTPEQADKLKLLHDRTKVPVAVYIREGIDLVLRHYAHLLPGQLPLVDSAIDVNRDAQGSQRADGQQQGSRRERASTASLSGGGGGAGSGAGNGTNGVTGSALNGGSLNGGSLNGGSLNGGSLNGGSLNGGSLNGGSLNSSSASSAAGSSGASGHDEPDQKLAFNKR
jgi:hypothetical protein